MLNARLGSRAFVDQIDDAHIGDAGVALKANLTCSAVGVTHFDMMLLYLRTKFAECIAVHLRIGESPVAREATATHPLWQIYIV